MAAKLYRKYGKKIVDAKQPLILDIERQDIKGANPTDDRECPIARCTMRQPGVLSVSVGANFVYVEYAKLTKRFVLSTEDRKMVRAYDEAGYFRPCTVTLLPPPPSVQIGARKGSKPGTNVRAGNAKTALNRPPLRHVRLP